MEVNRRDPFHNHKSVQKKQGAWWGEGRRGGLGEETRLRHFITHTHTHTRGCPHYERHQLVSLHLYLSPSEVSAFSPIRFMNDCVLNMLEQLKLSHVHQQRHYCYLSLLVCVEQNCKQSYYNPSLTAAKVMTSVKCYLLHHGDNVQFKRGVDPTVLWAAGEQYSFII